MAPHSAQISNGFGGRENKIWVEGSCVVYVGRGMMPILLCLPHLNDWREAGRAFLGWATLSSPGLLLSYVLRTDYTLLRGPNARAAKGCVGYWTVALVGYFIGLGITIMAVAAAMKSQPTLLYFIPFTLGPICAFAYARGKLPVLWAGSEVESATDGNGDLDDDDQGRR
jgi:hypothetical protein